MTIVTKVSSDKKPDNLDDPLFQNISNEAQGNESDTENGGSQYYILQRRARRMSAATTVCGFLTAILVLSIGIMGGVYLFRQFARAHRFRGWCSIPYLTNDRNGEMLLKNGEQTQDPVLGVNARLFETMRTFHKHAKENVMSAPSFMEGFEIDLEFEEYELIEVPDFRYGRRGRFIHDFAANKTAIMDIDGGRCFLMSLDRRYVAPPRTLFDLVNKMLAGTYEINTEVIRETMSVHLPAMDKEQITSRMIRRQCWGLPVYRLERNRRFSGIQKRSVENEEGEIQFGEFPGSHILIYKIVNPEVLMEEAQ